MVITDGKQTKDKGSFEELAVASSGLKSAGVQISGMGIGKDVDTIELAAVASDPEHVFQVDSFEDLEGIVKDIKKEVCAGN